MVDPNAPLFAQTIMILGAAVLLGGIAWVLWGFIRAAFREAKQNEREEWLEHGACANCGYDLRTGHHRCPECGEPVPGDEDSDDIDLARLGSEWPDTPIEPVAPQFGEDLSPIYSTTSHQEADLIIQQLMARGVWCVLRDDEKHELAGNVTYNVVYYRIGVPKSECDRATMILDGFRRG